MTMLLLLTTAFAGKFGTPQNLKKAEPDKPAEPTVMVSGTSCNHHLMVSAEGLRVCGKTVPFAYPASQITELLGPWDRTWTPESEGGVPVQKYVYDSLGLTVREPSDGPQGSQVVMLELTCDEQNRHGPFADKPFAGVVQVGEMQFACSTLESEVKAMLERSGAEHSTTSWQSYRIPLGEYEVAVGFPLDFQRPSPEADVPVSYIELRPKKD